MNRREELKIIEQIARDAGAIVWEKFRHVERLTKTHAVASDEAVTEADRAAQRYIVAELKKQFPGDGIIGEESDDGSGITLDVRDPSGRNWVIDPIDGTNNFIAGLGGFCICVGLLEAGEPVAGAVYDVMAKRMYFGARSVGAFVDGQAARCAVGGMTDASILCMTANLADKTGRVPGWANLLLAQIRWKVRILGSAALEAVLVGEGVAGAAIQVNTKLWDVAAAAAVVLEAGGIITDLAGKPIFPFDLTRYSGGKVPYIAAAPLAHADVLRYLLENP